MKKELTQKFNQIKTNLLEELSKTNDPEIIALLKTQIDQINELDKKFGVINTTQDNNYRLEHAYITSNGSQIFRARKSYGTHRKGFYIGNIAAVKQFVREHPDIVFNNLSRYGIKP